MTPHLNPDERVLVIAPFGQDARAMADLLTHHGYRPRTCHSPDEACTELNSGAGALVLTEEVLELADASHLFACLKAQPPWSELPLIILTASGHSRVGRLLDLAAAAAGSATLLERPIGTSTLLRSVEVALRSRRRQYQVRDLLEEQRRVQNQLARRAEEMERLLEVVPTAVWIAYDGRCETIIGNGQANEVFETQVGENVSASTRPQVRRYWTPDGRELTASELPMQSAAASNAPVRDVELHVQLPSGQRITVYGNAIPLRDEHGGVRGCIGAFMDITARQQAEDALRKAQQDLQQHAETLEKTVAERTADLRATNEQLETFVYSVAHDLRAPLRSMGGYSQLLLDDYAPQLDPTAQHLLKRIQASSEFMDKLLLDLLAYGRAARTEMELVPVEVRKTWETALFQCATQIEQAQAKIHVAEPLATVMAHEVTLGQCLANLLSNALKFVAPGVRPEVKLWTQSLGEKVRIWLEDNGTGIPADQHERIFRVFERLHGSRFPGTGIGLSIVRKGVERMGGTVGLESELGRGTRFWIELPKPASG